MFMVALFLQPVHEKPPVHMMTKGTIKDMYRMEYY